MQTRYIYILRFILPIIDLLMLNAVYLIAFHVTVHFNIPVLSEGRAQHLVICNLLWLLNSFIFGLYQDAESRLLERIYRGTWKTVVLHVILFTFYLFFSKDRDFSSIFLLVFYGILFIACILNRFLGTIFQYVVIRKFKITKSVAIMGNNYTAARLKNYLKTHKNINFYGFIGTPDNLFFNESGNLQEETIRELTLAVKSGVKDLYVCLPPENMTGIKSLIQEADSQLLRLKFIPDMGRILAIPYTMTYFGGQFPMITIRNEPLESINNRFKKRSFDIIFSSLVIIFILSWVFPIVAILIKLGSKGPVLFRQYRSGRDDLPFLCYKFRSMRVNDASHSKQATKDDMRITRLGKFLRKTSLDELPQFINVFQGHMSVVGPRPHMLKHTEQYRMLIDKFMVRHFSKPGITGWAQVNGLRGETKETIDMEQRVEHDIYYVENWTLMWDIKIIFLTIINIVRGEDNAF